ncbi:MULTISPECIES: GntR family transcriptional regulator [unclassified Collinsella]|uniref:GntR family transcriptional regulator n=1 Tax=unclassified Collinsella TaxID=2637548 RepID=UPI003F8963A2
MLDYNLEKRGDASLYEYIYQQIRDDIVAGRIAAGEHLPSKRAFANHLGISVITIENAYSQLLAEGYICSMPRRGYYACKLPDAPVLASTAEGIDRDAISAGSGAHDVNGQVERSMRFLLLLWRRRGFGKARCGRRWHPKTSAKSFRPRRHRAPLGYDAQLPTICAGQGV